MTTVQQKALDTVTKLLRLTLKGKLEWARENDTRWITKGSDSVVDVAYIGTLVGTRFALYEERFRTMDEYENIYWSGRTTLKIIDDQYKTVWEFPQVGPLDSLFNQVQLQAAGVEGRLDQILGMET